MRSMSALRAWLITDPLIVIATVLFATASLFISLFDRSGRRQAAVVDSGDRVGPVLVDLRLEGPKESAGRAVDRPDLIHGRRVVHYTIDCQREGLDAPVWAAARILHPGKLKLLYIAAVDLIEGAEVPGLVCPVVHRPVIRILVCIEQRVAVELRGPRQAAGSGE